MVVWIFVGKSLCVFAGRLVNLSSVFKWMCLNSIKVCSKNLKCCCSDPPSSHSTPSPRCLSKMKWITSCSQWGYVPQSVVFNKSGRLSKQLGCRYLKFPVLTCWTSLISTTVLCILKLGRKKKKEQDVYEARRAVLSFRSPAVGNPCKPWLLTALKHTGSTSVPNSKTFSIAHRIFLFEAISGTKLRI